MLVHAHLRGINAVLLKHTRTRTSLCYSVHLLITEFLLDTYQSSAISGPRTKDAAKKDPRRSQLDGWWGESTARWLRKPKHEICWDPWGREIITLLDWPHVSHTRTKTNVLGRMLATTLAKKCLSVSLWCICGWQRLLLPKQKWFWIHLLQKMEF